MIAEKVRNTVRRMREDYCLQFGCCNLHSHTCIQGIEAMNGRCLECKSIVLMTKEVRYV